MQLRTQIRREEIRCPFCHDQIGPELDKTGCESCMAWHHLECWDTHGGCSGCGYTRDHGPGLVVRASDLAAVPRVARRARPGECAAPGCQTRIPLVSTPQLCAAHLPAVQESAAPTPGGELGKALMFVLLSPILILFFPLVALFWLVAAPTPRQTGPVAPLSRNTPPPDYDTPSPDYA